MKTRVATKTSMIATALALSFPLTFPTNSAFAAAGSLDPTFGTNGIVQASLGGNFQYTDAVLAPNGDIVVAGTNPNAIITRFLPSGAPDTTFGAGGVVTLASSTAFADSNVSAGGILAVQSTGKILVLTIPEINGDFVLALQRFNANGTPDTTFGSGGVAVVNVPEVAPYDGAPSMLLAQPDGKILVAGTAFPPFKSKLPPLTVLGRYLSTGAVDTTFGAQGFTSVASIQTPTTLALVSGDGILALNDEGQLAQFTPTGALVSTPTGGTVVAITQSQQTIPATFQTNADYLLETGVQGPFGSRNDLATISRFLVSGLADPSFASPEITFGPDVPVITNGVSGMVVDSTGRVVIGGNYSTVSGRRLVTSEFALARVEANGTLDTTFGTGGTVVTTELGNQSSIGKLLLQPNGEIVAVGIADADSGSQQLAIARYLVN